jgi:DNA-binding CsgD family transcriptional regulator/tetratricopeptide (TPR) repeat protein
MRRSFGKPLGVGMHTVAIDKGLSRSALAERDQERAALERCLQAAARGSGRVAVVEGSAGIGKSRLLEELRSRAVGAGIEALVASGSELETQFPFGVAIQLFEGCWANASDDERDALRTGPATVACGLLDGQTPASSLLSDGHLYPVIHGLLAFVRNLLAIRSPGTRPPLMIIVDDAQLADAPSLRFLAYTAARLETLPICLVVAVHPGEKASEQLALASLRATTPSCHLALHALSRKGTERVVHESFPESEAEFVSACFTATRGNPFLLTELLSQITADRRRPDAITASELTELVPNAIVPAVARRLDRMSAAERSLAICVALLGDGVSLELAAQLAELDSRTAAGAADSLADVQVLVPGLQLSFVHPVVRSAVLASISPASRAYSHRRAATILQEQGAPPDTIAEHLLASPTGSDPEAVDTLRAAARMELQDRRTSRAVRYLSRALEEEPPSDVYPEVVAELGQAEARAGMPRASEHLEQAIEVTEDPYRRAELALSRGRVLMLHGHHTDATAALASGLRELEDDDVPLAGELEAAYLAAASFVPELASDVLDRRERLLATAGGELDANQRSAVATTVLIDSVHGAPRSDVRRLAELAWKDGSPLVSEHATDADLAAITAALLYVDELEPGAEICNAIADHHSLEPRFSRANVASLCAWIEYEQGKIDEAFADARTALDAPDPLFTTGRTAHGALACCRLLRGEIGQAEAALAIIDDDQTRTTLGHPFLLESRARVRLAQQRPADGLDDALTAGKMLESDYGVTNPGACPWRSTAALAEIALGRPDRGEQLAAEELELAQRIGATRVVVRDLRVLSQAVKGPARIDLLEQAVDLAEHSPPRLESILALVDFGAALRRAKRRAAAREPLRKALELSYRGGVTAVADRARFELEATGARPRRTMLSGPESLTPSERRVADLATQHLTTRMIAEQLVISPKTVEYHLRHIYQKLDINSRPALAAAMGIESYESSR